MEEPICPKETPCVSHEELPSVMRMAKNLASDGAKIVKNAIKGNQTLVDDDTRNSRWSICQSCPFLQNDRCVKCGCFMKVKVAFQTSNCPENKW